MARLVLTLTAEMDLVQDAIADIERIFCALGRRHGQRYRDLERRIERLADCAKAPDEPKTHWLSGGRVVVEPTSEMKAIIRESHEMGVI